MVPAHSFNVVQAKKKSKSRRKRPSKSLSIPTEDVIIAHDEQLKQFYDDHVHKEQTPITLEEFIPWELLDTEVATDNNKSYGDSSLFISEEALIIFYRTTSKVLHSNDGDLILSWGGYYLC